MVVAMDLCDVLLPAYKAVLDASAKTERTSRDQEGLRRSATERRGRDKNSVAPKDGSIGASSLSPGDIKIARDCVKALKVLKRLASESAQPSSAHWAGEGEGSCRSSESPETSATLQLQASSSGEEKAQDEPLRPTLSSLSQSSSLTAASSFKSCCSAFDAGGQEEMRGLLWRARGSPVPDVEARALLSPLVGACRGSEVLPQPGSPGPRRREASAFAVLSLQCFQLLVSHGLLVGPAEDGTLMKQALDSVFFAYTRCTAACENAERKVDLESDVVQALLIFFCSPSLRVHGTPLLRAVRVLLHIQSHSLSSANRCLAKAAAAHLLSLAAQRAESARPWPAELAGACTPVALLPWGSPEMPTQETLRVVQQCMSQLMQEVALADPDCSPVRDSACAQDAQEAETWGVQGGSQMGREERVDVEEGDFEDAQPEAGGSPVTGSPSPRSAQGERSTFIPSAASQRDRDAQSRQVRASSLLEGRGGALGGAGTSPVVTRRDPTAGGRSAAVADKQEGSAPGVALRERIEAREGAEAPLQASTSGAGTAELGSVESQQSTIRWARSDSGCSATTSSSSTSSTTLRPSSCHGGTPGLGPKDGSTRRQVGRRRRALWAALTGKGRRRASVEATLTVEQASLMPALALDNTLARAELLPKSFRVGNLEAMDRLFASREFALQQANAVPGGQGAQEECSPDLHAGGEALERRDSVKANLMREDALSVLRLLCDLVGEKGRKGGSEAGQELPLPDEAVALELLLWLLDCCGPKLLQCSRVTALLRDRLCPALLRQWSVANPSVFSLCYSVLLRLVALFRDPLLPKLRLLLPHMLLRPLEDRGAVHPRATWMALHLLHCLAQQPLLLLGLYANLDCHLGSPALVERTLAALASVAATPPAGGVPHDPRHQPAAEATLLAVLSALRQWASGMPPVCPRVLGTEAELLVVEEAERACAEAGFVAGLSYGAEAVAQRRAGGGAAEGGTQEGRSLQSLIEARALFQDGVAAVSQGRTQSGVELLLKAHSRAYGQDLSPAVVLFQYGHCLEGAPVGELLGAKESASLLAAYMACFDFRGVTIDEALRMLLSNFRLPGEAQKIDRIMEAFAERFWHCNAASGAATGSPGAYPRQNSGSLGASGRGTPAPFRGGAATAHVLAFSIIMLHTDAHSPAVKVKMSKEDFIRNNRGVDDGQDLPAKLLSSLYDRIVSEEMRFLSPETPQSAGGGAAGQGKTGSGSAEGLGIRRSSTIQKLRGHERGGALSRSTSKKVPPLAKPGSALPRASSVPSRLGCPGPSPGGCPAPAWLPLWDALSPLPFSLPQAGSPPKASPGLGLSDGAALQHQKSQTERRKGGPKRGRGRRATVHGMSPLAEHSASSEGVPVSGGPNRGGMGPERAWAEQRWWRLALASGTAQDWMFPVGCEAEAAHMFFERALFPHLRGYLSASVAQGHASAGSAAGAGPTLDGPERATSVHGAYPPSGVPRDKLKVPHPRGIERSASVHADSAGTDASRALQGCLLAPAPRAILGACAELASALRLSGVHKALARLLSDAAEPIPLLGLGTPQSEPDVCLGMSSLYLAQGEVPAPSPLPRRQLHFEGSESASTSGPPKAENRLKGLHIAGS